MVFPMKSKEKLRYLEDRWDEQVAKSLDEAELLRYRSNLLGSDLRITNFGGGNTTVAASIDTPLHGFLPFEHIDHLHPDWGIALAAAANGREKMEEFNRRFGHRLIWLPWQRPGFELAMMLREAVRASQVCDGIVLGGHGLFTWGETQRECYSNTLTIIDELGQFVMQHVEEKG